TGTGSSPTVFGGFGQVDGTTINNSSRRESYGALFTAYVQSHEIKIGGDYQNDETFGSSYYTGGTVLIVRPCLQEGTSFCDLSLAPSYTNANGSTQQVFFQHGVLIDGSSIDDYTVIPSARFDIHTRRVGAFLQDQWRVIPSLTVNVGVRYDT